MQQQYDDDQLMVETNIQYKIILCSIVVFVQY